LAAIEREAPAPPGEYDVVVVGSGPGGLQVAYSLARAGVGRMAVLSRDPAPGGMFRRFPLYQRLITWTKPDAPCERGTRAYESYDHNSLVGEEPEHQALLPGMMDRSHDLPTRREMESALVEFAARGRIAIRFGCEWRATRRDERSFVVETSDGEYRCRVCVFAVGMTEPWKPSIPGIEAAPHYAEAHRADAYAGKSVLILGKRNSAFELAQGLLPWARRLVLASPRPVETALLGLSPLRLRYLQPLEEYLRGGAGSFVVDAAIERIERRADGYRVHTQGTSFPRELVFDVDEVIVATGFRAPLRDLPALGVATVNDGRLPAQTPYWESVSVPDVYFAGNVTQGSPGLRKHGVASTSTSVSGFRYNARILAGHIAQKHFGLERTRPSLRPTEVLPLLAAELARAPELWLQKGYLARALSFEAGGIRDLGVVPLADFVDQGGPDACAATVEHDAGGTIVPVVYVRRGGRLAEHVLPTHPLHEFDGDDQRRELAARVGSLLGD
jgi:thioredoxin reductase